MGASVQLNLPPRALLRTEKRAQMAKADLPKKENAYYADLGGCMDSVRREFGLTLEGFAHELGKDVRQVGRQIEGKERPQLEIVFAIERFRGPLVIALARLAADVDVVTEIRVRRTA